MYKKKIQSASHTQKHVVLSGSNMGISNSLWNIILTSVLSESVPVRLRKMAHSSLLFSVPHAIVTVLTHV